MPNIANAFKAEISRLARKELRSETDSLKKAVASYRSEIAALKRRVAQLEKQARRTPKAVRDDAADMPSDASIRFRADGFAQHRQRLGLTAAQMAKLLGVSALSVYKWETGKTKPRARQLPAIAAVRKMGKREVAERLSEL